MVAAGRGHSVAYCILSPDCGDTRHTCNCRPARGDLVAVVGETFGDAALRAMAARMRSSPAGREILEQRPRVTVCAQYSAFFRTHTAMWCCASDAMLMLHQADIRQSRLPVRSAAQQPFPRRVGWWPLLLLRCCPHQYSTLPLLPLLLLLLPLLPLLLLLLLLSWVAGCCRCTLLGPAPRHLWRRICCFHGRAGFQC